MLINHWIDMLTFGDIKPMSGEKTPGALSFTQWGWGQEPVHEAPPPSPSLLPQTSHSAPILEEAPRRQCEKQRINPSPVAHCCSLRLTDGRGCSRSCFPGLLSSTPPPPKHLWTAFYMQDPLIGTGTQMLSFNWLCTHHTSCWRVKIISQSVYWCLNSPV